MVLLTRSVELHPRAAGAPGDLPGRRSPGRDFGARNADTHIAYLIENPGVENMKTYRADISERLAKFGRKPTDMKVLFMINPIMADTDEEARDKQKRQRAAERRTPTRC